VAAFLTTACLDELFPHFWQLYEPARLRQ